MIIDAPRPRHTDALRRLWQEAFGDSEAFLELFWKAAFAADRCRCVTVEDEPVAALYWLDCTCRGERLAYLYAVATAKTHRGQGLCTALMADTHRHLSALGYVGTLLVPGEAQLFAFYEKMGYRVCGSVNELACRASRETVALRRIGIDEYASLRRAMLPAGGVVQEGEHLRFLEVQAECYVGDGVLLAARREGEALWGMELLGDASLAPAIVGALGCTEGRFRTPGDAHPFAMYRPLRAQKKPPAYFGLAFD